MDVEMSKLYLQLRFRELFQRNRTLISLVILNDSPLIYQLKNSRN